jgi:hypothetical protein
MDYQNFMKIKPSNEDVKNITNYLNCEGEEVEVEVYSKIVIQFNEDSNSFTSFIGDTIDTDTFALCHEWIEDKLQYILYTLSDAAFIDVCNLLEGYECDIIEFILEDNIFTNKEV